MGPSLKTIIREAFDRVSTLIAFHKEIDFMPEKGHIVASVKGVNSFGETLYREEMLGTVTYTETVPYYFAPIGVYEVVRRAAVLSRINGEEEVEIERAYISVLSEHYAAADVLIVAALACALDEAGLIIRKVNTTAQLQPGLVSMWPAKTYSLLDKPYGTDFLTTTADMLGYTKEAITTVITDSKSNLFIRSVNNGEYVYIAGARLALNTLVDMKIDDGEEDLTEVTWKGNGYNTGNHPQAIGRSSVVENGELYIPVLGVMYNIGRLDIPSAQGVFQQTAPIQHYQNGFPAMSPQPFGPMATNVGAMPAFGMQPNYSGFNGYNGGQVPVNQGDHHFNKQGFAPNPGQRPKMAGDAYAECLGRGYADDVNPDIVKHPLVSAMPAHEAMIEHKHASVDKGE